MSRCSERSGPRALTVGPPNPAVLASAGLARSRDSIVKVMGVAPMCQRQIEGSGFVFAPHHVMTNAHVVAGVSRSPDRHHRRGLRFGARVVLLTRQRDLAVLYVPRLDVPSLRLRRPRPTRGDEAVVAGYPRDAPRSPSMPAQDRTASSAQQPGHLPAHQVTREIYSIRADVEPGDSGGPLLAPGRPGLRRGVRRGGGARQNTGYALTASEVESDAKAAAMIRRVSTQACD